MDRDSRARPLSIILLLLFAVGVTGVSCSRAAETSSDTVTSDAVPSTSDDGAETTTSTPPDPTTSTPSSTTAPSAQVMPRHFWAIDQVSLDLVLVEVESGEVSQRLLGWGARLGEATPEGGLQSLYDLAPAGDAVWVEDCCEPAVGRVYRANVAATTPVPQSEVSINGVGPIVSPDGTQLAVQVLDFGVAIHDGVTGELQIEPGPIDAVVSVPADAAGFVATRPLVWLDADTIAVATSSDTATTITFVSLDDPSAPAAVGPTIQVDGRAIAASQREDGALVVAVTMDDATTTGLVHDVETGDQLAVFDLPDGTEDIEYEPTGSFLLVSTDRGVVFRLGGGETVEIADGFLQARWAPDAEPAPISGPLELAAFDAQLASDAGIDTPGGCSFYRNGATGTTIFFSGLDGAFAVIDGEDVVFQTDQPDDGPFTSDGYMASFENLSDRVPSSIESNERSATLVVTTTGGGAETRVNGIIWCGV